MELDGQFIKKLKRGELLGNIGLFLSAVSAIWLAVGFAVARTQDIASLQLAVLISAPCLIGLGAGVSAFCSFKYSNPLTELLKKHIKNTLAENARALHPEKNSLTFFISLSDNKAQVQVNGYKEKTEIDFTAFGKLSLMRKAAVSNEIADVICNTFSKLYERGVKYENVSYIQRTEKKTGKEVFVIKNGEPDKDSYKRYLKSK